MLEEIYFRVPRLNHLFQEGEALKKMSKTRRRMCSNIPLELKLSNGSQVHFHSIINIIKYNSARVDYQLRQEAIQRQLRK